MLTNEDLAILSAPFKFSEHESNPKGFQYIAEESVTQRIETVDPSWEFRVENVIHRAQIVSVVATMTIKGVTRSSIGSQTIEYLKGDDKREAGEPEKAATTDALRRCARLFGVGRYLLSAPRDASFSRWLARLSGEANAIADLGAALGATVTTLDEKPMPSGKPWTNASAQTWLAETQQLFGDIDLREALEVERLGLWNGDAASATARVRWYAAQRGA